MEGMEWMKDLSFFRNKRILITGNTGFKGSWMSYLLLEAGAEVIGYALEPTEEIALFRILQLDSDMKTYYKDIRDFNTKVILLTRNNEYEYNEEYLKYGFAGYLLKPTNKDKLLEIIDKYL